MESSLRVRPLVAVAGYFSAASIWGAAATALPLRLDLDPASSVWMQAAAWGVWIAISCGLTVLTLARAPQLAAAFMRSPPHSSDALARDLLTGLPGRALLRDRLEAALAQSRRVNRLGALLLVDLDRFRSVNETHGHTFGDALLRLISRRIGGCVRDTDSIARLDGDSFAIVAADLGGMEGVEKLAARLRAALDRPFRVGTVEIRISASVGIAVFSGQDEEPDRLLSNAETALYTAKETGKNHHNYFLSEMTASTQRRARLELDLRHAIGRREIIVHYQPRVDLSNGRIGGIEALARWKHAEFGWVSPGEFIPLAEESGLMLPLGALVLRQSCSQIKRWQDMGLPKIPVAVNFSPSQFLTGDVVSVVTDALKATGLDPHYLEVELTEGVVLRDPERVEAALHHLRGLGVRVALDDFGTGYSSLSHLKRLPLDMLKVDRAFVSGLNDDGDGESSDAAIVGTVITLGRNLGLQVVAEGVESAAVASKLMALGCVEAQGYYFSPPVAAEQLEALLAGRKIKPIAAVAAA